jgi:hypothetical protein
MVQVPDKLFDIVPTAHGQHLSTTAVTTLSREWVLWIYSKTGKFNIGENLTGKCAAQFAARWKQVINKKGKVSDINWTGTLRNQAYLMNRPDASVSAMRLNREHCCSSCCSPIDFVVPQVIIRRTVVIEAVDLCEKARGNVSKYSFLTLSDGASSPTYPHPLISLSEPVDPRLPPPATDPSPFTHHAMPPNPAIQK